MQESALPIRRVADLAATSVSVVSRALKQLEDEELIESRAHGNTRGYRLCREHENFPLLDAVFRAAQEHGRTGRTEGYGPKAKAGLAFASEAVEIYRTLRKKNPR